MDESTLQDPGGVTPARRGRDDLPYALGRDALGAAAQALVPAVAPRANQRNEEA